MSWAVIARQDGALTVRARSVRYLLGLLAFVLILAAYVYPITGTEPITTARFSSYVTGWLTTLVPLIGIVIGYNAVVSDRESGALYLSLSLPHSREAFVLGRFAGRLGAVTATILAATTVAGALVVYPMGELVVLRYLLFVLLTVVFGAIWTGLGVAVSASVSTRQRALVCGFVLVVLFVAAWGPLESTLQFGLNRAGLLEGSLPGPVQFVFDLDPGILYERLIIGFVDPSVSVEGPWYRSEWMALVLYGLWAVGPLGLAIRRFAASDLS